MLPRKMLPRSYPDGSHIAFDDHRLVNNAGLILPVTLAQHLNQSQGGMCICRVLGIGAGVSRECFGP